MAESALRARVEEASGWIVQRQLGRGQYGTAYLVEMGKRRSAAGQDRGQEREEAKPGDEAVAKVVGLEFLPEKEHSLAFQEVELMRNLKHPGIVSLTDHFLTEASLELVIVMEWCDGGDLRNEVKRRAKTTPVDHFPEDQIMVWFIQLTLGLNYIHQRHILHRDLKSSNVFLRTSGDSYSVKIGDFGISRVLEGTVDVAATVVGTPFYMSPEVCKAEPYSYKSDIWALGCVLYEMCMLKHAFESQSLLGLVYKIVSETHPDIPPQYSDDLRKLLNRVLDKSQYARPSGRELMTDAFVRRFNAAATAGFPEDSADPIRGSSTTKSWAPQAAESPSADTGTRPSWSTPAQSTVDSHTSAPSLATEDVASGGIRAAAGPGDSMPQAPHIQSGPGPGAGTQAAAQEGPLRREWCDPPFVAGTSASLSEEELHAKVLIGRMRQVLTLRPQNWLQVFASFDQKGDGQLPDSEFERAVTSLALGLSDQEIRDVRASLQGGRTGFVPVDSFGAALHRTPQQVRQLELWGQGVLAKLVKSARLEVDSTGVSPGAKVRVEGLQSVAGLKLNGCEGVVEKWDMQACRWVVRITDGPSPGMLKSIQEEKLLLLSPASSASPLSPTSPGAALSGCAMDTSAIYRMLCGCGETSVSEDHFLSVATKLASDLTEAECRRLLWLLPKSPDGRIDVPEVLSQLALASAATPSPAAARPQATAAAAPVAAPAAKRGPPGPIIRRAPPAALHTPFSAVAGGLAGPYNQQTGPLPGAVPSPRAQQTPSATAAAMAGSSPPGRGPGFGPGRGGLAAGVAAEAALLRLGQRVLGQDLRPGPGLEVLRLFAARREEVRLDELLDAVSVLPLGLSRAEVQGVFAHLRKGLGGSLRAGNSLSFAALAAAVEGAHASGVPLEAAGLERVSLAKIGPALARLGNRDGGRAPVQEFRVALMQAEPYLTHSQLEWLVALTDKDGEGRLLSRSLLVRLKISGPPGAAFPASPSRGAGPEHVLPRRPPGPRAAVAPGLPRPQVAAAVLDRIRQRLVATEAKLTLERVLGLFFEPSAGAGASLGRDAFAGLLGHLRLGVSAAEADELFDFLGAEVGGRPSQPGKGSEASLQLALLHDALSRVGEPEAQAALRELREAAAKRLQGRSGAFACPDGGDFQPEAEFRRCLRSALGYVAAQTSPSVALGSLMESDQEAEEERLLLLAEKSATGDVRWRAFVQAFCANGESGDQDDWGEKAARIPMTSPKLIRIDRADPSSTAQSWRSMKVAQIEAARAEVAPVVEVGSRTPKTPTAWDGPPSPSGGVVGGCCRRRR